MQRQAGESGLDFIIRLNRQMDGYLNEWHYATEKRRREIMKTVKALQEQKRNIQAITGGNNDEKEC